MINLVQVHEIKVLRIRFAQCYGTEERWAVSFKKSKKVKDDSTCRLNWELLKVFLHLRVKRVLQFIHTKSHNWVYTKRLTWTSSWTVIKTIFSKALYRTNESMKRKLNFIEVYPVRDIKLVDPAIRYVYRSNIRRELYKNKCNLLWVSIRKGAQKWIGRIKVRVDVRMYQIIACRKLKTYYQ